LGGFAIGVQVVLLWQHSANAVSASACTRSMPGLFLYCLLTPNSVGQQKNVGSEKNAFLENFSLRTLAGRPSVSIVPLWHYRALGLLGIARQ